MCSFPHGEMYREAMRIANIDHCVLAAANSHLVFLGTSSRQYTCLGYSLMSADFKYLPNWDW
jgi:hypothetical protein